MTIPSVEVVSSVTPVMDVTTEMIDAVVPAAGTICGVIIITLLLGPVAPFIIVNDFSF